MSVLGRVQPDCFVMTASASRIGYTGQNADGPVMDGSKDRRDSRVGFGDAVPSHRRLG
jgi:hypothetical protein